MPTLPGPQLDPATLLFAIALMGWVLAAFSFSTARSMPAQRPSLHSWGLAMAAAGGAFLLYFLRGHIAWGWSFLGGNALVLLVPVLIVRSQSQLVKAEVVSAPLQVLVVAWSLSGVLGTHWLGWDGRTGATTMSSGIAILAAVFCQLMAAHPVARTLPGATFSAVASGLLAVVFAWRAWAAATGRLPPINQHSNGPDAAHLGSLLVGGLFLVATSISFFTMVHELRRREVTENARRDGLTGLLTRSAFFEAAQAVDPQRPCAVAMVDLDHFKRVNDEHGHAGGDVALAHMARLIANTVRSHDLVGRYGGEEFCVLLRDCDAEQALGFGQRLVAVAQRSSVRLPDDAFLSCTLSVGVACRQLGHHPLPAEALDTLLNRADRALYRAKALGRNRAEFDPAEAPKT